MSDIGAKLGVITPFLLFIFLTLTSSNIRADIPSCNTNSLDKILESQQVKHLDISIPKSKKWTKNYFGALRSPGELILDKYKKKFDANIEALFDNDIVCTFPAKVRISGDYKDHISGIPLITSLDVKLTNGNIGSTIKFKLFIPHTRDDDNEIFTSAFMKELGFLSPKTYYVSARLNGQSAKLMFQEKVAKEFLEMRNLREAPILEGDERFAFANKKAFDDRLMLARLVNKNWAKKGLTSLNIAKESVATLNKSYLNYMSAQHIYQNGNPPLFSHSQTSDSKDRNKEFKAVMLAIGAGHGLHPGDRKFYYDPMFKKFEPIYYDGNSTIIKLKNSLDKLQSIGNKLYFLRGNPGLIDDDIIGAQMALESLENFDKKSFYNKLEKLGLSYTQDDVSIIVDRIFENLKVMIKFSEKQTANQYTPYFSHHANIGHGKRLAFSTEEDLRIEVCDFNLIHCEYNALSISKYAKLLQGRYSNMGNDYIFVGNRQEYETGLNTTTNNEEQTFDLNHNTQLVAYGEPEITIDKKSKTIKINQSNDRDRILIKNGEMKDWSIYFVGSKSAQTSDGQRFNQDLLTGCLTMADMSVKNINIEVIGSPCEDGINLIRVSGKANNIIISSASSDAIDADFSKIDFNNINISNAGNDCVDFSAGHYSIQNATLSQCKDKAISIGEKSQLSIDSAKISHSDAGLVAKDSSIIRANTIKVDNTKTCLSAYNKKQEFWGGKITIKKHNCHSDQFFQQQGSLIEFIQ